MSQTAKTTPRAPVSPTAPVWAAAPSAPAAAAARAAPRTAPARARAAAPPATTDAALPPRTLRALRALSRDEGDTSPEETTPGDAGGAARIAIQRTTRARPRPAPEELRFGQFFTDHMFLLDYARGRGWQRPRIAPFESLSLSPAAAGLHYGQAMFDGLKAIRGVDGRVRVFRLERHCRRLARGAARLCMPAVPVDLAAEAILELVRLEQEWIAEQPGSALYLRPTLLATEAFLGVRPADEYAFFVIASPLAPYFGGAAGGTRPLRIWVEESYTRAAPGGLGGVKAAANYAASLRAAEDARRRGYSQVLWTDAHDHSAIEEVGTMNVFVHLDDEVVTPPLDGTILGGVTRDAALTLLRRAGHRVRERRLTMDEILEAHRIGKLHEVFGCGTAAGVAAVAELAWQGERIRVADGGEGPLARQLLTELHEIQTGLAEDLEGWMTLVNVA